MASHRKRAQVIAEVPPTAPVQAVATATTNVSKGEWLDWALEFAQEDLEHVMPAKREYWRLALKQFLLAQGPGVTASAEAPGGPAEAPLATDAQVRAAQRAFVGMIEDILAGKAVHLGRYALDVWVSVKDGIPSLIEFVDLGALPDEGQAQYAFARLLGRVGRDLLDAGDEGPLIKVCRAPKPRRQELCSRWFAGRPNRLYCSPHCQGRATTRALRARRQPAPPS